MTLEQKRKNKKLAKRYGRLSKITIIYWILQLVAFIVIRNLSEGDWTRYLIPLMIAIVVPVFVSMGFWMISGVYQSNLQFYKRQIKEYRVRVAYKKCMDFIEAGDLNAACEIYNDFIPVKHPTRDYLFSVLIVLMSRSTDPDLKKRGDEKLAMLNEFYNSAKINF
jgi:hypothetical protein